MGQRRVSDCDLCGCPQSKLWMSVGAWRLVQCVNCGLVYLNPQPQSFLYHEDYFTQHVSHDGSLTWTTEGGTLSAQIEINRWQVALLEQHLPTVPVNRGKLLDAGCATGVFLAAARLCGWQVFGFELSPWAAQVAADLLELDVAIATIDALPVRAEAFDVITCYHTLEHVPSPRRALDCLRAALKPTGLLVAEVPNLMSLEARLEGARWHDLQLPHHLYHFTPRTLVRLLFETGFQVVDVDYSPTRYVTQLMRRLPKRETANRDAPGSVRSRRWRLRQLLGRWLPGRDLRIYARRADRGLA